MITRIMWDAVECRYIGVVSYDTSHASILVIGQKLADVKKEMKKLYKANFKQ